MSVVFLHGPTTHPHNDLLCCSTYPAPFGAIVGKCNRPFADEGILRRAPQQGGRLGRESDPLLLPRILPRWEIELLQQCCWQVKKQAIEQTIEQWWCRRFKSSQVSRTIICIHQCMYNVNTEDAWFEVDSCMYICRLVYCVNISINILDFMVPVHLNYLNVIKSYMSSAGAKYADIMA